MPLSHLIPLKVTFKERVSIADFQDFRNEIECQAKEVLEKNGVNQQPFEHLYIGIEANPTRRDDRSGYIKEFIFVHDEDPSVQAFWNVVSNHSLVEDCSVDNSDRMLNAMQGKNKPILSTHERIQQDTNNSLNTLSYHIITLEQAMKPGDLRDFKRDVINKAHGYLKDAGIDQRTSEFLLEAVEQDYKGDMPYIKVFQVAYSDNSEVNAFQRAFEEDARVTSCQTGYVDENVAEMWNQVKSQYR